MILTLAQQEKVAADTYTKVCALITPHTLTTIQRHNSDPQILRKGDNSHVHIRILPKKSQMEPLGFWHATGCYYEILITNRSNDADFSGLVQFFRYANQVKCGGPKFTPRVSKILRGAKRRAPVGFDLTLPKIAGKFHLQRKYTWSDFPAFPTDLAAADLAWLIENTLSQLQNI